MLQDNVKVFTHSDLDGIGCGVLLKYIYKEILNCKIDISYVDYNNVDRKIFEFLSDEENIKNFDYLYITDISFKDERIIDLINNSGMTVRLIDHHVTAEWLNDYNFAVVTSVNEDGIKESGTSLVYKLLLKNNLSDNKTISGFVDLVRSFDTWDWKKENTIEAYNLNQLFRINGKFKFTEKILDLFLEGNHIGNKNKELPLFDETDMELLKKNEKEINDYVSKKFASLKIIDFHGYKTGVVFLDRFHNNVSEHIFDTLDEEEIDINLVINIPINFSIRSRKDIDVSKIAQIYNGGGHYHAAGFGVPKNKELLMEIIEKVYEKMEF